MNRIGLHIANAITAILIAIIAAGCTERSLECRPQSRIVIEWVDGPVPDGAVIILYPVNGGEPLVIDSPAEGYTGHIPAGEYNIVVYSANPQDVELMGMDAYQSGRVCAISHGDKLLPTGQISMGHRVSGAGTLVVPDGKNVEATVYAYQLRHTFQIEFILGGTATGITSITGQLLGVPSQVKCSTLAASGDRNPVDYTAVFTQPESTMKATVTCLGYTLSPGAGDLSMSIELGGTTHDALLDLTSQIQAIIDASGGKLPLFVELVVTIGFDGVEFTATVTSWKGGNTGSGTLE